jgi:hypothetical protein
VRTSKFIGLVVGGGFFLLAVFLLLPAPNRPFAKYICSPVPKTVRVVSFEGNDWFGANPEPVCYLSFTAGAADVAAVIRMAGFQPASTNIAVPVPSGPEGWVTADQVERVYTRNHKPASRLGLPIGGNRIWSEFLWIDKTGTNAYFLLWGV